MDLFAYSQQMSQRLPKADRIPECGCGMGKMAMHYAGKNAMNAGRYYLKCPANLSHSGSFQWCDVYIRGISGNSDIDECVPRLGNERMPPMHNKMEYAVGCRNSDTGKPTLDLKTTFIIVFFGILMVIVGILMGKLM